MRKIGQLVLLVLSMIFGFAVSLIVQRLVIDPLGFSPRPVIAAINAGFWVLVVTLLVAGVFKIPLGREP